ncbi:IQ domain-containing protein E-like isoform X2 [Osmerus eperlanus]|uniref:IQ domain-containing protein E-like isoform X2 n=1 Tax=Osmerus eperlanus TaxID=29151 RepID=UPI002E0F3138
MEEERGMEEQREEEERGMEEQREEAARMLQRNWLRHREKDTVMLQSAMRAHLLRHTQLHTQSVQSEPSSDVISPVEEEMEVAMTLIQSVFRGHLARTGLGTESSTVPSQGNNVPVPLPRRNFPTPSAQLEVHHPPTAEVATTMDSDDSDDIIVSPSRPLRRREELLT